MGKKHLPKSIDYSKACNLLKAINTQYEKLNAINYEYRYALGKLHWDIQHLTELFNPPQSTQGKAPRNFQYDIIA